MKIKKKTKKNIARVTIVLLVLSLMLPLISNMFYKPTAQDMLYQQIIENQMNAAENEENNENTEAPDAEGSYLVTEVITPDTYKIKWGDEEKTLKLIGVKSNEKYQNEVKEMVESRLLTLEFDEVTEDEDGNLLAYAYLEDGLFLNYELVLQGYAAATEETENIRYQHDLKETENLAKNSGVGIWEDYNENGGQK